ncbi:hypothetical protein GGR50DRAFT_699077 [Xylaria sp. CBS 124048]|nr:hypothetical protein GGR50DRAFT_699077 [Xylaria sp. CBS 124048]
MYQQPQKQPETPKVPPPVTPKIGDKTATPKPTKIFDPFGTRKRKGGGLLEKTITEAVPYDMNKGASFVGPNVEAAYSLAKLKAWKPPPHGAPQGGNMEKSIMKDAIFDGPIEGRIREIMADTLKNGRIDTDANLRSVIREEVNKELETINHKIDDMSSRISVIERKLEIFFARTNERDEIVQQLVMGLKSQEEEISALKQANISNPPAPAASARVVPASVPAVPAASARVVLASVPAASAPAVPAPAASAPVVLASVPAASAPAVPAPAASAPVVPAPAASAPVVLASVPAASAPAVPAPAPAALTSIPAPITQTPVDYYSFDNDNDDIYGISSDEFYDAMEYNGVADEDVQMQDAPSGQH